MAIADKPVDVGTGVVCASFARDGSWLSIGCLHPDWGFVELSGLPPFDEGDRGDAAATRRYRRQMTDRRFAWLHLEPTEGGTAWLDGLTVSTFEPATPRWKDPRNVVVGTAFGAPGGRGVVQHWRLDPAEEWRIRVNGRIDRPALAEITEVNPLPPTGAVTELRLFGRRLVLRAPDLPAVAVIDSTEGTWSIDGGGAELRIRRGVTSVEIAVTLAPEREPPAARTRTSEAITAASIAGARASVTPIDAIVARALTYVRSCTALLAGPGERAILTDHRLLPLSWTRDAYYQALLLLASRRASDRAVVADHLRWVWGRCDRPDGRWMRSHHGNGRPKDQAFQADQQLYPFVELADLWRATGTLPDGIAWQRLVPHAWRAVLETIDPGTGLIGTEENAADDRVAMPFVAASQILLWYAAMRLAEPALAARTGLSPDELGACARQIRSAFERHLVVEGLWAYAVDGSGRSVAYHDANDIPTILAPAWGFCRADDPGWRHTVDFAFSERNPGFVGGSGGGLGSAHTPGVWPLGHVQAWLAGTLQGDAAAATEALEALAGVAFDDGMLPEAVVGDGSTTRAVRHWFAWPGAAFGAFWLIDQGHRWADVAAREH